MSDDDTTSSKAPNAGDTPAGDRRPLFDPAVGEVWRARMRRVRSAAPAVRAAWGEWRRACKADRLLRLDQGWGRAGPLPVWVWLVAAVAVGLALRLYYFFVEGGIHYPDEIFQYLEPAYSRMSGCAWLPWEFDRGIRNWILPGYYGGLMELGNWLGLHGWQLHRALAFHNSLLTLLLIPAGWRLGRAVGRGDVRLGMLGAFAAAAFPLFSYFAPHTLSEVHGLLATTWAYALWLEDVAYPERFGHLRRAFAVGLLLGAAFICRYTLIVCVPLVLLDYNFRVRFRELFACLAGLAIACALLGIVDAATWGRPFRSVVEYFRYNWLEDGASEHGVMPQAFYWTSAFVERLGFARWLLLVPMVVGLRRHWRLIVGWLVPLLAMSTIKHKEERFLLSIWPFVLVAAASGWLAVADHLQRLRPIRDWRRSALLRTGLAAVLLATVCIFAFFGTRRLPMRWKAGIFAAQTWVGRRADASGILVEDRLHLNGGYVLLDRCIPQLQFSAALVQKPIFNYVAVYEPSSIRSMEQRPEWRRVAQFEETVVFRRTGDPSSAGLPQLVASPPAAAVRRSAVAPLRPAAPGPAAPPPAGFDAGSGPQSIP
jgi:hypothetical protein